jgi:hypothetical protein
MKKFVIALSPITSEQSGEVTNFFRGKYGWWHWIAGVWLVMDHADTLTAPFIRDQLNKIAPQSRKLILDVTSGDWAGHGPRTPNDMFDWIKKTWNN